MSSQPANAPDQLVALIEIPLGGRAKYEYDADRGRLMVDRLLPEPFGFPANYGTFPCTLAGDGDPLDVLVLTDVVLQPGTLIAIRPIAIMRMTDSGAMDDKIMGVPVQDTATVLPSELQAAIQRFFESYKGPGAPIRVGPWGDSTLARAIAREAIAKAGPRTPE